MTIENVIEVNEIMTLFHLKLQLKYTWIDRRLTYHNLKPSTDMNNLAQETVSRMWLPQMTFENIDNMDDGAEPQSDVKVWRDQKNSYSLVAPDQVTNARVYRGEDSTVEMTAMYSTKFRCSYLGMTSFPFDSEM